jgi:hypothetical protein
MWLMQEWLYRPMDVNLRFAQVSALRSLVAASIHIPLLKQTLQEGRNYAWPRCLVDWALHQSAEHASQQHSAPQLHQSQPLQSTVDLRPVSRASSGTSSLVAEQRPLHYTAAWLYAAPNTAGESPLADTKTKHGILATALGDCTT